MNERRVPTIVLTAACLIALAGCGAKYIEGTKIPNNETTRTIIGVVEKYRQAMEMRDAEALVGLASADYFERNGNNNSRDNYDYAGLVAFLRSDEFRRLSAVSIKIFFKEIEVDEKAGTAEVRYFYVGNYRKPPERFSEQEVRQQDGTTAVVDNFDQENWHQRSDDNLMTLRLEGEEGRQEWKITGGM